MSIDLLEIQRKVTLMRKHLLETVPKRVRALHSCFVPIIVQTVQGSSTRAQEKKFGLMGTPAQVSK